ncbi:MAG: LLM class F420-dependent oxidoreductase [Myxococcota bacterium]
MEYGLTFFSTDYGIHPADLARGAEERGFESIWLAEHSHIPVTDGTPGPPEPGKPGLPREYYAAGDPFVALAMAAAVTTRLRIATGICLVPQRDVFQTAKLVATLDQFSGGRFLFGVGGGWNRPEIEDHGTPFAERFAVMRERIEAMQQLWTQEKAEYHGKYVDFTPCCAWPKPAQNPHPPIHVGGAGVPALRRTIRYGDGWVPLWNDGENAPLPLLPRLRELAEQHGRDVERLEVSIYFCPPDPDTVERCREAGITRVLFPLGAMGRDATLAQLDRYRTLME